MITKRLNLGTGIFLVALLLGACTSARANPLPEAFSGNTPVPDTPVATTAVEPQSSSSRVAYEGVSFELDSAIATGIVGETVPENPGSSDGPYWEILPQYVRISLSGYPLSETSLSPIIAVYPVDRYRELSEHAGGIIDGLEEMLAQKAAAPDPIPALPIVNAGQVFHSNLEWMNFGNGSGVRFLTIYAQYPAPVNNQDLFYNFQGLTDDGRYAVSISMPVNHPSLPASPSVFSQSEMEAIINDYDGYRSEMAAELSARSGGEFTPDLAKLDALVASLEVKP